MPNIHIGIATAGRRGVLSETIRQLSKQARLPDRLYVCGAASDDVDVSVLQSFPAPTEIVSGGRGLTRQRNAILRAAGDADLIVFLDDDFLPDPSYLAEAERFFAQDPDMVVATGLVLADGASGPGLSPEEGLRLLNDAAPPAGPAVITPTYSGYGCNMVVRLAVARQQGIEFDEKLPLYGWWEDIDFCRRLAEFGTIRHIDHLRGVHLGSKNGRTPGKRLGYSQVANLIYLLTKGSITRGVALERIGMNVAANMARSFYPEPWVDRRGRLMGNMTAFADLLKGTISPDNISKFK